MITNQRMCRSHEQAGGNLFDPDSVQSDDPKVAEVLKTLHDQVISQLQEVNDLFEIYVKENTYSGNNSTVASMTLIRCHSTSKAAAAGVMCGWQAANSALMCWLPILCLHVRDAVRKSQGRRLSFSCGLMTISATSPW